MRQSACQNTPAAAAEIVRLGESQIEAAGGLLARAFRDDPIMVYAVPDRAGRERILPDFYTRMVRFGYLAGEVYTTSGTMDGVSVWLPPGVQWTREKTQAAGLHELSQIVGADAMARYREVVGPESDARERFANGPYWYLFLLAVEPSHQGRGLGGELIEPMLERIKNEGMTCLLETENPRNVAFYVKHGFEIVVDGRAAGRGGVRFWTFRRTPTH